MSSSDAPQIHPAHRPDTSNVAGRTYWQSFEHLADSPEIEERVKKEFAGYDPAEMVSIPRRTFMKYVAASMALAGIGLSGCRRWPKEQVAPYAHKPLGHVPGVSEWYATSWELGGVGKGLLVSSFDGRPLKVEGNPQHPGSRTRSGTWGSADIFAQAQPLTMYDPDRSRDVVHRPKRVGGEAHDLDWFKQNVLPPLQNAAGGSVAVLAEPTSSPTMLRLREELEQAGVNWYTYAPVSQSPRRSATEAAFGKAVRPVYQMDKAMCVVSFDDDYLGLHPNHTRYAADWSVLRASVDAATDVKMSRCYQLETCYSITGASADIREPIRPSRLGVAMKALAAKMGLADEPAGLEDAERNFVEHAFADLQAAGKQALIAWGEHLPQGLQVLAMEMNAYLGNSGTTLRYIDEPAPAGGDIADLVAQMNGGSVQSLVILGGNPVYDAPADVNFAAALRKVPTAVHLSLYDDETSALCTHHVPQAHFFECFGDTRGYDGTVAPAQPLISPLFDGIAAIEMLAMLLGKEQTASYELVRETMQPMLEGAGEDAGDFDKEFRRVLHNGVVENSAAADAGVGSTSADALSAAMSEPAVDGGELEVRFSPSGTLYDGRFANNGWLMESPDNLTKLTWDNAALMNIMDARRLGVSTKDMVTLSVGGREVELPVYVMPGQPEGVVGVTLGFGRTRAGAVGNQTANAGGGFDVNKIRSSQAMWFATGATATAQGQDYPLAMTQNHFLIDKVGFTERAKRVGDKGQTSVLVHESTFEEHKNFLGGAGGMSGGHADDPVDPEAPLTTVEAKDHEEGGHDAGHGHPSHDKAHAGVRLQIFNPPNSFRDGEHAWGMTIDMNACIGCSACVVACQSENNIPVVGKDAVMNNREMHWLRIDRYFKAEGDDYEAKTTDSNPDVSFQPMMCVHCETAPCEQVCPVAATVHDAEGLNTMVYNRCIGTRYCGNNCPYKVRRFNYFDWHYKDPRKGVLSGTYVGVPDVTQSEIDQVKRMVFNPDVTVRMRGVMEKCTYCTQRIKQKTIWRGNREETVQDMDILTACQQACPTEAIIFGNLNDSESRVSKQQDNGRTYEVLGQLNLRPRTKWMARIRNRALMAGASESGH